MKLILQISIPLLVLWEIANWGDSDAMAAPFLFLVLAAIYGGIGYAIYRFARWVKRYFDAKRLLNEAARRRMDGNA